MRCNDCINYKTCELFGENIFGNQYANKVEEVCLYFKDKSLFVELPCKVGQICYKVWQGEILEVKVASIHYEPLPSFTYTIRFNSLGVLCLMADGTRNEKYSWDIYITKEEAERKLREVGE